MKRFRKVLVSVDTRFDHQPIVDEAVTVVRHSQGEILLVDVMPEPPALTRRVMTGYENLLELSAEEKQKRLEALAEPVRQSGIPVATKVLQGRTSVAIIQEAMAGGMELVMRITKGQRSRNEGFFGTTAWRLLRHCPCPVWLLRHDRPPTFQHVLGCVDTSSGEDVDTELNDAIVELATSLSQLHGGRYSLLHAWSLWGEALLRKRMAPDEFREVRSHCQRRALDGLQAFLRGHDIPADAPHVHLVNGDPKDVIPEFAATHDIDLLVMGTLGRAGLVGLVMGNDVEKVLGKVACSVLALKPKGFACTIDPSG